MAFNALSSVSPEKKRLLIIALMVSTVAVFVCIACVVIYLVKSDSPSSCDGSKDLYVSESHLGVYSKAAISSSARGCADVGRDIFRKGGSAVDAAVSVALCISVVTPQSSGIGGGFFMTYYQKKNNKAYTLIARERAPLAAHQNMYNEDPAKAQRGGLAIAVPGEVKGLWEAHQRFGSLPWKDLFQPIIQLCRDGVKIDKKYAKLLKKKKVQNLIFNDKILKKIFTDEETGKVKEEGESYYLPLLADTLETIAEQGESAFYNGEIGRKLVEDIKAAGGIITMDDLKQYSANWVDAGEVDIGGDLRVFTVPPPSSGLIMAYILNILSNYHLNETSLQEHPTLTYHRIAEAFKFAYVKRTELGDPEFVDVSQLIKNLTSSDFARSDYRKILDGSTFLTPQHYGAFEDVADDHGTSHLSIVSPDGDAVALTSTINLYFGSGIVSPQTGIILNDEMDDFSIPGKPNAFGFPPSESNFISPRKIPMSSMSPSVFIDNQGDVRLVSGAAGGSRIISSTALIAIRSLFFEEDIKTATDADRIHHQLIPMELKYEEGLPECVADGLKALGHKMKRVPDIRSVVCSVARRKDGKLAANSDYRKGGDVAGLD